MSGVRTLLKRGSRSRGVALESVDRRRERLTLASPWVRKLGGSAGAV